MRTQPRLPVGIPDIPDYQRLVASPAFAAIKRFSDDFLDRHHAALRPYANTWVTDPLHQWSRQWEYPFTLSRLAAQLANQPGTRPVRILDAGSGVTFLPYLIVESFEEVTVHCRDHDGSLAPAFNNINEHRSANVQFTEADLHELPYAAGSFDAGYCVSVLEHLDRQATVVKELHRVLRPGGRLVLTFDLPLPADDEEYGPMLCALAEGFDTDSDDPPDIDPRPGQLVGGILTTTYAASVDRSLLPWQHPLPYRLSCLVAGHGWVQWPPPMAVACLSVSRRL